MSGLTQGSMLGPTFYVMLSNSLLSAINLPLDAFADDLKFLANVTNHTKNEVQAEIDKVSEWADAHLMPLSIEKSNVMHCGRNQLRHSYTLQNRPLTAIDTTTDFGITRTSDSVYSKHCEVVASKAKKVASAIRKIFRSRAP